MTGESSTFWRTSARPAEVVAISSPTKRSRMSSQPR
jgi:hypothetical protein